jgi:YbgC/YbaW family acyl-CoA thioester hydrolase
MTMSTATQTSNTPPSGTKPASIQRKDFRFLHPLRVRWAEVDMQKIVFNGHYLMYVDTAIAGYWRAMALIYEDLPQRFGGDMFVKKATLEYHRSAEYEDVIDIGVRFGRIGTSSLTIHIAIFCQNNLLVSGELIYVYAVAATQKSSPLPPELREMFEAFERGEPMVQVRIGTWDEMKADATALRTQVFVQEQGIPPELEMDANDAHCVHAVAYNAYGRPLGTGRLLTDGHIGRMAVLKAMRGSRVGAALLRELMGEARSRGHSEVRLNAQSYVTPFYRKAGFVECGEEFMEAGIAHVEMSRAL